MSGFAPVLIRRASGRKIFEPRKTEGTEEWNVNRQLSRLYLPSFTLPVIVVNLFAKSDSPPINAIDSGGAVELRRFYSHRQYGALQAKCPFSLNVQISSSGQSSLEVHSSLSLEQ